MRDRASSQLPRIGALLDAEEDVAVALTDLRTLCAHPSSGDEVLGLARQHLMCACQACNRWYGQGLKVIRAVERRFQQDAEDLCRARELMVRNNDGDAWHYYLGHVFCSVLIGQFESLCDHLNDLQAPDLKGVWGNRATRRAMETYLQTKFRKQLKKTIHASLEEVAMEMSKHELVVMEEVRRVSLRGAGVPWASGVRALQVSLQLDTLQHFAVHVAMHVALHCALDLILGELALGPVGLVVGVAALVVHGVKDADWSSVRKAFVKQVKGRRVELVEKARSQFDFAQLCESRRNAMLEQLDLVLQLLNVENRRLCDIAHAFAGGITRDLMLLVPCQDE